MKGLSGVVYVFEGLMFVVAGEREGQRVVAREAESYHYAHHTLHSHLTS